MSLGFDKTPRNVAQGDTVELYTFTYDANDAIIPAADIASVQVTVGKPDGTRVTQPGIINGDGSLFMRWTDTAQEGEYMANIQVTFTSGEVRSQPTIFTVFDPLNPPLPNPADIISEAVWQKLEDCFDSEDGGPWLRDMTLAVFNRDKVAEFINDALFDINNSNPPTAIPMSTFTVQQVDGTYPDLPLIVSGTLMAVIRQLMRAYAEQPVPQGANVVYEDRTSYQMRWQQFYNLEKEVYERWRAMFKRRYLGLGHSKVLVDTKAGRLLPAPLRSRSIGRGYW